MVDFKQERGDNMMKIDGVTIPKIHEEKFARMSEKGRQAYVNIIKSWNEFDESKSWYVRLCKGVGLDWVTLSCWKIQIQGVIGRAKKAIHDLFSVMDRLVDQFNYWIG